MPRVISIHEYILKPEISDAQFEKTLAIARQRQLFDLPGLINYHFIKGIKGARRGCYTAIWIYENREAWAALWGTVDRPRQKHEYPASWLIWEDELLAPLLTEDPDMITFTSYEEVLISE